MRFFITCEILCLLQWFETMTSVFSLFLATLTQFHPVYHKNLIVMLDRSLLIGICFGQQSGHSKWTEKEEEEWASECLNQPNKHGCSHPTYKSTKTCFGTNILSGMENWQSIKFRDSMTRKIDYNGIGMVAISPKRSKQRQKMRH